MIGSGHIHISTVNISPGLQALGASLLTVCCHGHRPKGLYSFLAFGVGLCTLRAANEFQSIVYHDQWFLLYADQKVRAPLRFDWAVCRLLVLVKEAQAVVTQTVDG